MAGVKRRLEQQPNAADFASDAGAKVEYAADGSWTATVSGQENIKRAVAMQKDSRAIDVENGQRRMSRKQTEVLVDSQGGQHAFPAHLAEQIADKRGWKPKAYWGKPSMKWVARDGNLVRVI